MIEKTTQPLKILVVLPLYGGSLSIGRFCVAGLRDAGHLVEVFEAPDFYPSYDALKDLKVTTDRLEYLENSYLQVVSQAVLAKVETFEPDLILAMAQAPLTRQALKRLKRDNVATAMWFVEDYRLFTYWKGYAPYYDVFAVIQKEPFLSELKELGVENGIYLPLAAQPDFHKPVELTSLEQRKFGADVGFMGAGYPNRRMAFREMAHMNFKIWGTEWDGDHVLEPLVQMDGRRVTSEECVKIYNASKINLNLHSSVQADQLVTHGDFVNPRTFELAACGAFQLVDHRTLMDELFTNDELAIINSIEEMVEKTAYYLQHPDERTAMAAKARERALRDHTYQKRMETLIAFTAERLPDWPRTSTKQPVFTEDFPPELQQDIRELLTRLRLPETVSFEDLVWAVRQQNGTLSELDAAILFLDEWRKMY